MGPMGAGGSGTAKGDLSRPKPLGPPVLWPTDRSPRPRATAEAQSAKAGTPARVGATAPEGSGRPPAGASGGGGIRDCGPRVEAARRGAAPRASLPTARSRRRNSRSLSPQPAPRQAGARPPSHPSPSRDASAEVPGFPRARTGRRAGCGAQNPARRGREAARLSEALAGGRWPPSPLRLPACEPSATRRQSIR